MATETRSGEKVIRADFSRNTANQPWPVSINRAAAPVATLKLPPARTAESSAEPKTQSALSVPELLSSRPELVGKNVVVQGYIMNGPTQLDTLVVGSVHGIYAKKWISDKVDGAGEKVPLFSGPVNAQIRHLYQNCMISGNDPVTMLLEVLPDNRGVRLINFLQAKSGQN